MEIISGRGLIEEVLQALQEEDNNGLLPLHHAIGKTSSPEIIDVLLLLYPEAVTVSDKDGFLPFHRALSNNCSL
jgi:hypothetical protein